jgi:hypothetical protein
MSLGPSIKHANEKFGVIFKPPHLTLPPRGGCAERVCPRGSGAKAPAIGIRNAGRPELLLPGGGEGVLPLGESLRRLCVRALECNTQRVPLLSPSLWERGGGIQFDSDYSGGDGASPQDFCR